MGSRSGTTACHFCNSREDNELLYGKFYELEDVVAHYFCLLLSSNMAQNGRDNEGILGFLLPDIRKELNRGKRLLCTYCKKSGATLGCCVVKCKKVFHLPCGRRRSSLHQFFGQFKSYCPDHRPVQKIKQSVLDLFVNTPATCVICYEAVEAEACPKTLWAPCCSKNAWFHFECVQQLALSAGYFFKCPLCNNKSAFQRAMRQCGIYIPEQDASWELVPNAFQELLHRHDRCDAMKCGCPHGRNYHDSSTRWDLILCQTCGSQGTHVWCSKLNSKRLEWTCKECSLVLERVKDNTEEESDEQIEDAHNPGELYQRSRRLGNRSAVQTSLDDDQFSEMSENEDLSHGLEPTLIRHGGEDDVVVVDDSDEEVEVVDEDDCVVLRTESVDPVVKTRGGVPIAVHVVGDDVGSGIHAEGDVQVSWEPKSSNSLQKVCFMTYTTPKPDSDAILIDLSDDESDYENGNCTSTSLNSSDANGPLENVCVPVAPDEEESAKRPRYDIPMTEPTCTSTSQVNGTSLLDAPRPSSSNSNTFGSESSRIYHNESRKQTEPNEKKSRHSNLRVIPEFGRLEDLKFRLCGDDLLMTTRESKITLNLGKVPKVPRNGNSKKIECSNLLRNSNNQRKDELNAQCEHFKYPLRRSVQKQNVHSCSICMQTRIEPFSAGSKEHQPSTSSVHGKKSIVGQKLESSTNYQTFSKENKKRKRKSYPLASQKRRKKQRSKNISDGKCNNTSGINGTSSQKTAESKADGVPSVISPLSDSSVQNQCNIQNTFDVNKNTGTCTLHVGGDKQIAVLRSNRKIVNSPRNLMMSSSLYSKKVMNKSDSNSTVSIVDLPKNGKILSSVQISLIGETKLGSITDGMKCEEMQKIFKKLSLHLSKSCHKGKYFRNSEQKFINSFEEIKNIGEISPSRQSRKMLDSKPGNTSLQMSLHDQSQAMGKDNSFLPVNEKENVPSTYSEKVLRQANSEAAKELLINLQRLKQNKRSYSKHELKCILAEKLNSSYWTHYIVKKYSVKKSIYKVGSSTSS